MEKITPDFITHFWFSERVRPLHFTKSLEFDREITTHFQSTYEKAAGGHLDSWLETAEGALALILVLDQFSRNMFRDDPRSFEADDLARQVSRSAIDSGFERDYTPEQRSFLYMPFMHSEVLSEQDYSVEIFENLGIENNVKFAIAHRDIIARFGRFPHRNKVLGRVSTPDEIEFLTQPGSGF